MDEKLLQEARTYLEKTKDDWNYILPEDLEKQRKKKDFYILDIRRPADYAAGHIPGAKNIFWLDLLKPENLKKLPKDKKIVVYCYVGHTSSQILTLLKLLGYDVVSLKFGMGKSPAKGVPVAGWLDFGLPTSKSVQKKAMFMKNEHGKFVNTESLDRVAEALENCGMMKEACDIDVISNTLERDAFAWLDKMKGRKDVDPWVMRPLEKLQGNAEALLQAVTSPEGVDQQQAREYVEALRRNLETLSAAIGKPQEKQQTTPTSQKTPGTTDEFVD